MSDTDTPQEEIEQNSGKRGPIGYKLPSQASLTKSEGPVQLSRSYAFGVETCGTQQYARHRGQPNHDGLADLTLEKRRAVSAATTKRFQQILPSGGLHLVPINLAARLARQHAGQRATLQFSARSRGADCTTGSTEAMEGQKRSKENLRRF